MQPAWMAGTSQDKPGHDEAHLPHGQGLSIHFTSGIAGRTQPSPATM
jgi:hypothetical protein